MIHRKIVPRKSGGVWYVNIPLDLRCHDPRKRRQFDNERDAADYAAQLNAARKTNLQFFFAMHPAILSEVAFRIRELGEDHALAALRRAKDALAKSTRTAADVLAEFLAEKESQVRKNSFATIKWAVKPLADNTRPIADISAEDIAAHLKESGYGAEGQKNALRFIKAFFRWCVDKSILPASPADKLKTPKSERHEIKILSVPDCRVLMHAAQKDSPELVPFLALQLFGGLRATEAARTKADDIRNGVLVIIGAQTKLGVRRAIPVSPQLASWLSVAGAEFGVKEPHDKLSKLKTSYGLTIPKNALRHSFCSYLFALGTDVDAVAKAAGNSAEILRRHYLGLASKADGEQFAGIAPA